MKINAYKHENPCEHGDSKKRIQFREFVTIFNTNTYETMN